MRNLILALGLWLFSAVPAKAAGELDLGSWQTGQHYGSLHEPWEFHWEKLLEADTAHPEAREWLAAGRSWNDAPSADGTRRPAAGFATYKLTLRNVPMRADGYQIGIKGAGTAYRLMVYPKDDPHALQLVEKGQIDPQNFQGSRRPAFIHFFPTKTQDYIVLLQIRNVDYAWGGLYFPVFLGTGETIRSNFEVEGFVSVLGMGIMLSVGIYSLMMWVRRREDKAALMLALVSLAGVMRLCSTSPFITERVPDFFFSWLLRQEFLSMNMGICAYLAFLVFTFRAERFTLWDKLLNVCNLSVIACCLGGSLLILPYLLTFTQVLVMLSTFTFIAYSYKAWRRQQSGASLVLLGCFLIALAAIFDIASAMSSSEIFITPWAVMLFLILQSQIVGLRAAEAHQRSHMLAEELQVKNQEITDFNRNLEKLVDTKTRAIRSLLDHIPQGVFTIGRDGRIAKDFSAHLTQVLEIKDPGLKDFDELFLAHCHLRPDEKDQIQKTIAMALGDSRLNFELNRDKFPDSMVYQIGPTKKHLKATWNVQLDEAENVEQILVTLLDVTAEKSLEQEAHEQQLTLEKIKQLVDQKPERVQQFFSTAQPLLSENLRIIEHSFLEASDIRLLFVNAHTVKGAARTLLFRSLADAIHMAEDHYAMIIKGAAPDREQLRQDCQKALAELESYREINRVKLNRSEDLSKIVIDRELVLSHYHAVSQWLEQKETTVDDLMEFLHTHSENLTKLIFEQLPTIFEAYRERASKIAKDLGKAEPHLHMDVPAVPVAAETRIVLDNCMIHILRNALDHGIENPDERRMHGKAAAGSIWIKGRLDQHRLILEIHDDGRGLALARLRELGLKNGRLNPTSSDEAAAALIFEEGMTTSQSLTAISGRGIGMSAIRRFLREAEGSIELVLNASQTASNGFRPFLFRITLPLETPARTQQAA
jgi:PAS domain-containing protein/HPt (histidine-containing phosphotransfer) domain-containing protein